MTATTSRAGGVRSCPVARIGAIPHASRQRASAPAGRSPQGVTACTKVDDGRPPLRDGGDGDRQATIDGQTCGILAA